MKYEAEKNPLESQANNLKVNKEEKINKPYEEGKYKASADDLKKEEGENKEKENISEKEAIDMFIDKAQEISSLFDDTSVITQKIGVKFHHPEWLMVLKTDIDFSQFLSRNFWDTVVLKGSVRVYTNAVDVFLGKVSQVMEVIFIEAHKKEITADNDSEFKGMVDDLIENKRQILSKNNEIKKIAKELKGLGEKE